MAEKFWRLAAISVLAGGSAAVAHASEMPPLDYGSERFVDASGCVFVRSELHGWTLWVQRLDEDRRPDCDEPPTRLSPDRINGRRTRDGRT